MRASFLATLLAVGACAPTVPQPAPSPGAPALLPVAAFAEEIARFEAADLSSPPRPGGVLFVGSSSIRLWPVLTSDFPGVDVLQRGFGGAELSDVVRYAPRIVLPYRPRLIVLYAGENDIAAGKSAAAVVREYQAFVSLVRRALPETRIAFVSMKPSGSRWGLVARMREANDLVRRHAATDKRLLFVDVFTPMLGADGKPREELFVADRLHLSAAGYALWRELLSPIVREE